MEDCLKRIDELQEAAKEDLRHDPLARVECEKDIEKLRKVVQKGR